ncbi:DUF1295 domain-containing protein [Spongiibacter sp. KMU-158]|uniref:DUF1295 domain-containing protein n=1 Tax=Spongiibacter pelagi TaxID=2760804 RepID=A0A927C4Z8_9GAMM|nr:DUF1295 domain-containing protein [Spongiibacter pelagi]MBD2859851.1 DUF1295 domain-containing protein [Spongiibacter pelagi]
MTITTFYHDLLLAFALMSVAVFVVLQWIIKAAYGRHNDGNLAWWWGPSIPTRWSWVVMEAPSSIGFAVIFFMGAQALSAAPLLLFTIWQVHYFHRSFIYPFKRKLKPGDTTPLLIPALAVITNLGIAFLNAAILSWSELGADYSHWLSDPRLWLGLAIFGLGFLVNRHADAMLAALRKPGESGYKIPRGWLYEYISCPNYLGEILIWTGWAVASWSEAGAVFVLWTTANLLPRALSNHRWYRDTFEDYPTTRKALIPGVL